MTQISRATTRPTRCDGCPLNPQTDGHDPTKSTEFVPPHCDCPSCASRLSQAIDELTDAAPSACQADLLLVGIAPGAEETRAGEPFVGPAGRKLSAGLQWAGGKAVTRPSSDPIHFAPVSYFTRKMNLVNCRTVRSGYRGAVVNRDPSAAEIRHCARRWLLPIVERFEGKAVVALGGLVYKVLYGELLADPNGRVEFGRDHGHRLPLAKPDVVARLRKWTARGLPKPRVCQDCGGPLPGPRRRKCDACRKS